MHLGPEEVLVTLNPRFKEGLTLEELGKAVRALQDDIRRDHPEFKYIFIASEALADPRLEASGKVVSSPEV